MQTAVPADLATRSRSTTGMPRWHARYQVEASADVAGAGVLLYHPIQNLSLGGICIRTPAPEPVGSRLTVTLSFGGRAAVQAEGEVAWVSGTEPREMGLRWVGLTAAQRRALAAYLERQPVRQISRPGDAGEPARA